jgi:hypothetical protein
MGRVLGVRRIIAGLVVGAVATAGLAVGAGSVGAGSVSAGAGEPNCTIPGDARGPLPEPLPEPALIIEPVPREGRCATLEVTKVVNGTAPEGTIFRVLVQCERREPVELPRDRTAAELPPAMLAPFSTVLEFPATGGTQELLVGPSSCTVSETPPPGCTLASIDPPTVEITQPNVFQVLVTNNCAPPAPASTVNIQGTIVFSSPPPSPVVVATPRFTG